MAYNASCSRGAKLPIILGAFLKCSDNVSFASGLEDTVFAFAEGQWPEDRKGDLFLDTLDDPGGASRNVTFFLVKIPLVLRCTFLAVETGVFLKRPSKAASKACRPGILRNDPFKKLGPSGRSKYSPRAAFDCVFCPIQPIVCRAPKYIRKRYQRYYP